MLQATIVRGWRSPEIERIYDIAVDTDGYYFNDQLPPSRQRDYQRLHFQKRWAKDPDKHRDRVRESMKTETGRNNQVTTLKSIIAMRAGFPPHPQATRLTAEIFDKCREILVRQGKLPAASATTLNGQDYMTWITTVQAEYIPGQPRFGAKT